MDEESELSRNCVTGCFLLAVTPLVFVLGVLLLSFV